MTALAGALRGDGFALRPHVLSHTPKLGPPSVLLSTSYKYDYNITYYNMI